MWLKCNKKEDMGENSMLSLLLLHSCLPKISKVVYDYSFQNSWLNSISSCGERGELEYLRTSGTQVQGFSI